MAVADLRDLLAEYEKSQSDLAKLVGSRSHASEYLAGKRDVPLSVLRKMRDDWGVDADDLLDMGANSEATA